MQSQPRDRIFKDEYSPRRLMVFILLSPVTIWMAEFVHEILGHCLVIRLLGSSVKELFISPLAPYIPSRLIWETAGAPLFHNIIIASAGIAMSLAVLALIQLLLRYYDPGYFSRVFLFWLSFWIFINTAAYLLMGIILPYGDIEVLMTLGVLSRLHIVILVVIIIPPGLYIMLNRLNEVLTLIFQPDNVDQAVRLFWILLPMPFIFAEFMRASWTPPPLIGGSFLILLIPSTYVATYWGVLQLSKFDPREKQLSLCGYNGLNELK